MDEYVKLAKSAIETYVKTGEKMEPPKDLPEKFYNDRKGVFVTIYAKNNNYLSNLPKDKKVLRGCVGTFAPTKENIAREIIDNAISAAIRDCRFNPVSEDELDNLAYEVSLLNSPEKISSTENLNPKKYGVIVKSLDGRMGLLLPDIKEVETSEQQISIACQKAGINLKIEKIELFRFTVEKHK